MNKSVCFIGLSGNANSKTFTIDSELWALNYYYRTMPALKYSVNRAYNIHRFNTLPADVNTYAEYYVACSQYVGACSFDMDRFCTVHGWLWMGSTFSYMFADAIAEGYSEIVLTGVALSKGSEYYAQIPAMLNNIDIARKHGIEVRVENNDGFDREILWRKQFELYIQNKVVVANTQYGLHTEGQSVVFTDTFNYIYIRK